MQHNYQLDRRWSSRRFFLYLSNNFQINLTGIYQFHPDMLVQDEPCRQMPRGYKAVHEHGGMPMFVLTAAFQHLPIRSEIPF